jgi:pyruvate formate lyase activating enzyme
MSLTDTTIASPDCPWNDDLAVKNSIFAASATEGFIHSVETCGSVDGPGLRYVIFLSGCPLRCQYCHNPDTQGRPKGIKTTAGNIVLDALRYRNFILKGGGITVSGGEPLMQPAFTRAILEKAKQSGLHTALDTSGFLGEHADDGLIAATDLVLLDIKSGLADTHRSVTGVAIDPILRFAERLQSINKPLWIRFVLVPGLTDSEANLKATAEIISKFENCQRLEILPFHQYGKTKYAELGIEYQLQETRPAEDEDIMRAWKIFYENGISANLRNDLPLQDDLKPKLT